jgi:hypothetical protein
MTNATKDQDIASQESLIMNSWDWERFDAQGSAGSCYHFFIESIGDVKGKKVLDAVCGDGWLSAILAKRVASQRFRYIG